MGVKLWFKMLFCWHCWHHKKTDPRFKPGCQANPKHIIWSIYDECCKCGKRRWEMEFYANNKPQTPRPEFPPPPPPSHP